MVVILEQDRQAAVVGVGRGATEQEELEGAIYQVSENDSL